MKKLWITSALVVRMRMFLPAGSTSGLSTVKQAQLAGFSSSSATMWLAKSMLPLSG